VHPIRVLLADDNSILLNSVARLLENEFEVVARVADGTAAVRECERLHPHVVVLDISMANLSGIDVARRLRDSGSDSRIVFLTVHEDPDFISAAIGAGGRAYVAKSRLRTDLVVGIRAALAGELFISPTLLYDRG
jgi:DNA-binding NarL/FixJ family response regulator